MKPSLFAGLLALMCGALTSAAALAGPLAYITNQGSHDVSVVDLDTSRVIAALPAGWAATASHPLRVPGLAAERHLVVVERRNDA